MSHGSAAIPRGSYLVSEPGRCDVHLTLQARAENTALVRHVVGALAESLELERELVEDLRLVVTEAFTNVVRHAYPDAEKGDVEIRVTPVGGMLHITVTDAGQGMRPARERRTSEGGGLGLPLIAALSEQFEVLQPAAGGSVLQITFGDRTGRFQRTS